MLLVKYHIRHDQFQLPNVVVNLENTAVCLYLQNNIRFFFRFSYNPPDSLILHSDLIVFFFIQAG